MSQANTLDLPADALPRLTHLLNILHMFYHRNKNQHRHSIWWRHFSIFRRQLGRLVADLTFVQEEAPTTHVGRARKAAQMPALTARNAQRRACWRDGLVARWWTAFSQVVAEQRFVALGLVLLAVLADVCGIWGLATEIEEMGQHDVEAVLERFAREEWGSQGPAGGRNPADEDMGEVVARQEGTADAETEMEKPTRRKGKGRAGAKVPAEDEEPSVVDIDMMEAPAWEKGKEKMTEAEESEEEGAAAVVETPKRKSKMAEKPAEKSAEKLAKKKKKKRRKGNAIDDLFSEI